MKYIFSILLISIVFTASANQENQDKDYLMKRKYHEYEMKKKSEISKMKAEFELKKGQSKQRSNSK